VLADVESAAGNWPEFVAALGKLREFDLLEKNAPPFAGLALRYARALAALESPQRAEPSADVRVLRVRFVEEAVRALRQARKAGYTDWKAIERDGAFEALRKTSEFQDFWQEVNPPMDSRTPEQRGR
jgi:hypothetical protein